MNNTKSIDSLIGLCRKAGRLVSGSHMTEEAIRSGQAKLVIVTTDASDNTRKRMHDKSAYYHVPIVEYGTMEVLGKSIGQGARTALAVTDTGFADAIHKKMKENGE